MNWRNFIIGAISLDVNMFDKAFFKEISMKIHLPHLRSVFEQLRLHSISFSAFLLYGATLSSLTRLICFALIFVHFSSVNPRSVALLVLLDLSKRFDQSIDSPQAWLFYYCADLYISSYNCDISYLMPGIMSATFSLAHPDNASLF